MDDPQERLERDFAWLMAVVILAALSLCGVVAWVLWRLFSAIVWGA